MTSSFLSFNTYVFEWVFLQSSCIRVFRGYNGEDMFRLKKKEMDRLIGQQEAQRLESQILVQKNKEGVISNQAEMMIDACTFEIYNYLRCRRKKPSSITIQKFRNEIPEDFHIIIFFFSIRQHAVAGRSYRRFCTKGKKWPTVKTTQ